MTNYLLYIVHLSNYTRAYTIVYDRIVVFFLSDENVDRRNKK